MVVFGSALGFWAFLSVAALIIIYLIRPKPKDLTIPSLMFIIKDTSKFLKSSFLEKLLKNLVFLLQLIALAALALALTQPIINIGYDSTASNTVIVLDASASMSTDNNARFRTAVRIAKDSMKGDVSVVLAEDVPVLLSNKGGKSKASDLVGDIDPKDVGTNLGDSMLLAKDLLEGGEGRVLVLSDFAYTTGPDPNVVKKVLEAEGAVVDLVNVGSKASNVGIIDLLVNKYTTDVFIKNYNDIDKDITVSVISNNQEIKKISMSIKAGSVGTFSFDTPSGRTEVKINENDDLMTDNTAYISAPEKTKIKVLLISNIENKYLKKALESSKEIELTVGEPPIIPKFEGFDVIILENFDKAKLLTGTLEDMKKFVESGNGAIIMAKSDMLDINYKGMLPVTIKERIDKASSKVYPYAESSEDKYDFTEKDNLDFGAMNQYFSAEAENGSVVYAMTSDSSPIIVSAKRGDGSVVYYGIIDEFSTFKSSTSYPLFWNDIVNSLVGSEDILSYNYQTGKIIALGGETTVNTPSGTVKTDRILLDRAGFYRFNDKVIAANLINEAESDINRQTEFNTITHSGYGAGKVERRKDVSIENYLVLIALAAILGELYLIKYRGDL